MKTRDYLKDIIFFVLSVLIFGLINCLYIKRITLISDEKQSLVHKSDSLQLIVNGLKTEEKNHYAVIDSLERQNQIYKLKINEKRKKYEDEIVRVNNLDDSELLRFFTDYIDAN